MGSMWAFLVLLMLLFTSNQLVSGQTQSTNRDASRPQSYGSCTAVNNEAGSCLRIDDCTFFYNLLNQSTLSDSEKEMLKKSQCGQDNTQTELVKRVLVCCPERYYRKIETETRSTNDLPGDVIPRAGDCGNVLENRIYGGEQTQLDEFPWMALIRYLKPDKALDFHCGGSLINHRYVLTAAHCVQNINVPSVWTVHSVRLGEWNLTSEPDCITSRNGRQDCAPAHIDVLVEKVIVHELYVSESSDQFFDIALLRLAEGVTYTDFIKPICLPISFQVRASNFTDVVLDIAGWGATNRSDQSAVKLKAEVTVWDLAKCQEKYRRYQISINASQLCAGGKQGIDTCRGDSGGPLMTSELIGANRRIFYIAGIVSYGPKPCGLQGWPGVYTRVGDYVMWLQRNLKP